MSHTPLPWFVDGDKDYGSQSMHVTGRERNRVHGMSSASYSAVVCTVYGQPDLPAPKANAELIVKAVNSHDELIGAARCCQTVLSQLLETEERTATDWINARCARNLAVNAIENAGAAL